MLYNLSVAGGSGIYQTRVRWPKYSGDQNVYTLGYNDAGALLRRRLPGWSKADHLREAADLMAERKRVQAEYEKHVDHELHLLDLRGVPRGPLISGIVSDKFADNVKDALRAMAHHIGTLGGAAAAHYAAAGKRHATFLREFHAR